jgi:hypothetical protein
VDLIVGPNNAPSRRLILSRPLRAKSNFFSNLKLIWVVQIAAQKYFG